LGGGAERETGDSEARVELDDELLVDVLGHFLPGGKTYRGGLEGLRVHGQPAGDIADPVLLEAARRKLARSGRVFDLDLIAGLHVVAGDIDLVPVYTDVAVVHKLTGGGTGLREAQQVNGAVESGLKELKEALASHTALALGEFKHAAELALEQAVDETELLLFV